MHFKKNDTKYIIKSIGGAIYFRNDLKGCLKKKDEIEKELFEILIKIFYHSLYHYSFFYQLTLIDGMMLLLLYLNLNVY